MRDKPIAVEAVSVELIGASEPVTEGRAPQPPAPGPPAPGPPVPGPPVRPARARVFAGGAWTEVNLYRREELRPGDAVEGPAIIPEAHATTVVRPGWKATLNTLDYPLRNRVRAPPRRRVVSTDVDPGRLARSS